MLTVSNVWGFGPCNDYPYERIVALFDGRETLSFAEIAELHIPLEDRMWVLCKARRDRALEWNFIALENYLLSVVKDCPDKGWRIWANAWITGEDRSWDGADCAGYIWPDLQFKRATWYAKDIATRAVIWTRPGGKLEPSDLEFMLQ